MKSVSAQNRGSVKTDQAVNKVRPQHPEDATALGLDATPAAQARTEQTNEGGTAPVKSGQTTIKAGRGAPPSNTAPYNCNDGYFKALRWGVDSLYLSYPGELRIPVKLDSDSTPSWTRIPEQAGQSERSDAGFSGFTLLMS